MKKLLPLLLFAAMLSAALPAFAERNRYSADLDGQQEVPPVKTQATGDLKLNLYEDMLSFELTVTGLTSPVAAQLHRGKRGENGPPIAGLFGGPPKVGVFSGILAEGTISEENLLGELQGKKVADLVRLIRAGQTYLNIMTGTFPDGEIRGQVK
ncbi:CHRD domain-containing protein [Geomonas silvestris]|uniref:CHRD domain-containing protein n=1 Tax=Geomonas silvestris TaxID=2740184 RepID=A0A6V8MGF0_9BACT|nr:CHRD domain-containing protein [Geomonas silvestris]GFO58893.1 CHRD domain-containing protein [Geomonas silvestris]